MKANILPLLVVTATLAACDSIQRMDEDFDARMRADCLNSTRFMRHPGAQLCFAVCWAGADYKGGPAMTLVPDEYCQEPVHE